ncbi:MAG: rhodanese [Methylobacter sp.]|nr:MAG: rhodanese [Methylobacter sp.]PPD24585.1 MAG: rhodanese [Methylobacter sp.]PPD32157.1 MAG: rhodanese [Methylomonas sp.]
MQINQMTPVELKQELENQTPLFLLDVREPIEFRYAKIEGSVLIPLNQLSERLDELDKAQHVVVICHHGMRSLQAANYLVHYGFEQVSNLIGGVDAWSLQCDNQVPRY